MKNEQEERKMISEEQEKALYDQIYVRIGFVMQDWISTMAFLDHSICIFMGKEHYSPKSNLMSCLLHLPDSAKIKMFGIRYWDKTNHKYHPFLDINNFIKVITKGLESRNYFAHALFRIDKNGDIIVRAKRGKQDIEEDKAATEGNFLPVTLDILDEKRIDVHNAYELLDSFVRKISNPLTKTSN